MAVIIAVGLTDGELLFIKQDVGRSHVIQKTADICLCGDELHGNIITDFINGNGGILVHFTGNAVVKTVIQPIIGSLKWAVEMWILFDC